jgi:hypothetical protein
MRTRQPVLLYACWAAPNYLANSQSVGPASIRLYNLDPSPRIHLNSYVSTTVTKRVVFSAYWTIGVAPWVSPTRLLRSTRSTSSRKQQTTLKFLIIITRVRSGKLWKGLRFTENNLRDDREKLLSGLGHPTVEC